ncbi:MAG: type I secretion C-terminal target domain-containing protein, partial [Porticoccaceae bacterium]
SAEVDLGSGVFKIEDDGPIISPVRSAFMSNEIGNSLTDDIDFDFGTDGAGEVTLSGNNLDGYWVLDDGTTRMTSEGNDLLYRVNLDGSLDAYYVAGESELVIFTVTYNGDGTYTVNQIGLLDGQASSIPIGFTNGGFGGGNDGVPAYFLSSSEEAAGTTTGTEGSIMVTATTDFAGGDSVNFNNNALGVSQGSTIDDGTEILTLRLSDGADWSITGSGGNAVVTEQVGGADQYLSSTITLAFWGLDFDSKGEIPIARVYDSATYDSDNPVAGTYQDFVYGVDGTVNPDGTWTINATFEFDTVDVSASNADGNGFGVSSLTVELAADGYDQTTEITATATDGDGDTTSTTWDFTFDGEGVISGDGGDNVIVGNGESDILLGGLGDDIMTGGAGADTFLWLAGEAGTDTITDFNQSGGAYNPAEGDVLDLSALLVSEETGVLTDYLSFSSDGTDTTITVDADGLGAGTADQTIVLENVDLTGGGANNDAAIITSLLADSNLVVDTL